MAKFEARNPSCFMLPDPTWISLQDMTESCNLDSHSLEPRAATVTTNPAQIDRYDLHDEHLVSGVGCHHNRFNVCHAFIAKNYHTFVIYTISTASITMCYNIFLYQLAPALKEQDMESSQVATCFSVFGVFNLLGRVTNGMIVSTRIISPPNLFDPVRNLHGDFPP